MSRHLGCDRAGQASQLDRHKQTNKQTDCLQPDTTGLQGTPARPASCSPHCLLAAPHRTAHRAGPNHGHDTSPATRTHPPHPTPMVASCLHLGGMPATPQLHALPPRPRWAAACPPARAALLPQHGSARAARTAALLAPPSQGRRRPGGYGRRLAAASAAREPPVGVLANAAGRTQAACKMLTECWQARVQGVRDVVKQMHAHPLR